MNIPEIEELLRLVEEKYSQKLHTSTDFDQFSLDLKRQKHGDISTSTLKRLWGYVNDSRKPRVSTLDILARYIGHESFDKFVVWLKTSSRYNSSYFFADHLSSSRLSPGDEVEIGWAPNRILRLRYLGDSEFVVTTASNSKLIAGDRFICGCFIKGQPLCLPYILRNGEKTSSFIAGRNGGLNYLKSPHDTKSTYHEQPED